MRRRLLATAAMVAVMTFGVVGPVSANPAASACNGLDKAHAAIHGSNTVAEHRLHDLRTANHCGH